MTHEEALQWLADNGLKLEYNDWASGAFDNNAVWVRAVLPSGAYLQRDMGKDWTPEMRFIVETSIINELRGMLEST